MHAWNLKPARDYGLTPGERRLSVRRESGLGDSLMHFTWLGFARAFLVCWNRLAIIGRENLPEHPRFVMAANHTSHLDAPVLASALPMQWRDHASPIAAGDVFFEKRHLAAFAALMVNALPVWRRNALAAGHAMEALRGQIVAGPAIYILFPEGSRSRDGKIHAFKSGIGALVAGTDVPVLPCHITGAAARRTDWRAIPPKAPDHPADREIPPFSISSRQPRGMGRDRCGNTERRGQAGGKRLWPHATAPKTLNRCMISA